MRRTQQETRDRSRYALERENAILRAGLQKLHDAFQEAPQKVQARYWGSDVFDVAIEELRRAWKEQPNA